MTGAPLGRISSPADGEVWIHTNQIYRWRDGALVDMQPKGVARGMWAENGALWARAPNDVWLSGGKASIWHWDGASWLDTTTGIRDDLYSVSVQDIDEVYAGGNFGVDSSIVSWNGYNWNREVLQETAGGPIAGIWSSLPEKWAISNYGVLGKEGGIWKYDEPTTAWYNAIHGVPTPEGPFGHQVWAVGRNGHIWHNWSNSSATLTSGVDEHLNDVFAIGADDAWAVGDAGRTIHWSNGKWQIVPSNTQASLKSVCAISSKDVWAVGSHASTMLIRWDGKTWRQMENLPGNLDHLWCGSATEVWALSYRGLTKWNGASWSPLRDPNDGYPGGLKAISGSVEWVWAVGLNGAILRKKR